MCVDFKETGVRGKASVLGDLERKNGGRKVSEKDITSGSGG